MLTDITDRKQTESERDRLLQLEKLARAEAESANRIKDEFLAVLFGAIVIAVTSADEALQVLAKSKPDILLSDIGMPEISGYMLIQQVRALEAETGRKQIPAIALTAYAGEINQQQALKAGFQQHIVKPVAPEELLLAISNLIDCP